MSDEQEEDSTSVSVNRLLLKSRRKRIPVVVGSLLTLGFLIYMLYAFGDRHHDELVIDGPVDTRRAFSAPPSPPERGPTAPATAPPAGQGSVEIVSASKGAELWVDGQRRSALPKQVLTLAAGRHLIMMKDSSRTIAQRIFLKNGDKYRVEFTNKVTVSKLP